MFSVAAITRTQTALAPLSCSKGFPNDLRVVEIVRGALGVWHRARVLLNQIPRVSGALSSWA
jgi:hypothetical protein